MEKEIKESFDRLMSTIEWKRNFIKKMYNPSYKKSFLEFSVYEISELAGFRLFSEYPEEFNLTKKKGQLIREYFYMNKVERTMNELYSLYPSIFSGEPRWKIDPTLIESYVPTYDEEEIERNY